MRSLVLRRPLFPVKTGTATLERIVVPFQIKADGVDKDARTFSGHAAVWALDLGDDIIEKGAFKATLAEWKKSGESIPLLNSHDHWDIMSAMGQLVTAEEDKEGLFGTWEIIDGPDGDAVLTRLRPSVRTKRAVIGKMSIGYIPIKWEMQQSDSARFGQVRILKEVSLQEVSLVLFPMNPGASIDASSVKTFLDRAKLTEGKSLDDGTKIVLRQLASRIGILLSKKEDAPPPEVPAVPEIPAVPAVPEVVPTPPAPVVDPATPPPAPAPSPTALPAPAAPASTDDDAAEPASSTGDEQKGGVYLMSEALQQRLRAVTMKAKVQEIIQPKT